MGTRVVTCCGSFDGIVHAGHRNFLREARMLGDVLIVFVNTDKVIRRNKQREPLHPQSDRVAHVSALGVAAQVIPFLGDDADQIEQIAAARPDVHSFTMLNSYPFDKALKGRFAPLGTAFVHIPGYKPEVLSTTKLHFSKQDSCQC